MTDIAALIARLRDTEYRFTSAVRPELREEAAAALEEQQAENERLQESEMKMALLQSQTYQRAERAEAEAGFLHARRGELVIERDRYKAALGQYPEGVT